jgi:large subunit ribosomal protein L15
MSLLNQLTRTKTKSAKRIGRGGGSGKGSHTVGRGTKGQTSRVGSSHVVWFEGGQLPLIKRMPMLRGKLRFEVVRPVAEITLSDLDKLAKTHPGLITFDTLKLAGLIDPRFKRAKIIATGELHQAVTIQGIRTSATAKSKIEAAGGSVQN